DCAGADVRIDVWEEHDPRGELVRPADALRLLLVLTEVPRRVNELLRDDGRTQLHVFARVPVPARGPAALEVRPHRRDVELNDAPVAHLPDLSVVEGHQLHDAIPQTFAAVRA